MINYSIIIPHYNCQDLLNKCLDSIPIRDDVEIIIVDDNSDPNLVDFKHFPGLSRKNTKIIFSKGELGKGPGLARNIGINAATGKWIVFADSDDYFCDGFVKQLDIFASSDADVVFFKTVKKSVNGETSEYKMYNDLIDKSLSEEASDPIAYEFPCPWGKFINRFFLLNNNIHFQQETGGEDIVFSVKIALFIKKYELSNEYLYCVVDRPGSLTRNNDWHKLSSYTLSCCEAYRLMKNTNRESLAYNWVSSWWGRLWYENKYRAISLFPNVVNVMGLMKSLHCFKKATKVGRWDWENRER